MFRVPSAFRLTLFASLLTLLFAPSLFAQWEPEVRMTFDPENSLTCSNNAWSVATDGGNYVHVVWYDGRVGYFEIFYKRSSDGGTTWSADTCLTITADPNSARVPSVAVSGSAVHLIWATDNREIYYKRSTDNGTTWGPDTRLSVSPLCQYPSNAVSGSVVHAVWYDRRDGNDEIYYKRSTDNGTTWGPDTRLSNAPNNSWFPSVAVSGSTVHVVWDDDRATDTDIYYKRSTDNGTTWGPEIRLTSSARDTSWYPCVAVSGSAVHVVWADLRDAGMWNREIYYKRSTDSGTTWGPDTRLSFDVNASQHPSVAISNSVVHVVWWDTRDNKDGIMYEGPERDGRSDHEGDTRDNKYVLYEVYYRRSEDRGTTWGPETRLTNGAAVWLGQSVAVSGPTVHIVWGDERFGTMSMEIFYLRGYHPVGVEESSGHNGQNPEVGLRPNPFVSFARVPGHEGERFALYDISGRNVGIYKGDRIGAGLSPGVYFLSKIPLAGKPEDRNSKPLRIVKVR